MQRSVRMWWLLVVLGVVIGSIGMQVMLRQARGQPVVSQDQPQTSQDQPVMPQGRPAMPQGRPAMPRSEAGAPAPQSEAPQVQPGAVQVQPAGPRGPTKNLAVENLRLVTEGKAEETHALFMNGKGGRAFSQKLTFELITGPIRGKRVIPRAAVASVDQECKVALEGIALRSVIRLTITEPGPRCDQITMIAPSGPEAEEGEGLLLRVHVQRPEGYPWRWQGDKFSSYGLPWPTQTPANDTMNIFQLSWAEELKQWLLIGAMKPYTTQ